MSNQEISKTQPEDMVSIGAWYLLHDLRRIFCEHLYKCFLPANDEDIREMFTRLLNESLQHWKQTYKAPAFANEELQTNSLIDHLKDLKTILEEDVTGKIAGRKWIIFLEHLIIPYVISIPSADDLSVRPWFPHDKFLEFYQKTHSQNRKNKASLQSQESKEPHWKLDNPPLNLFITKDAFQNLRPQQPGIFQKLLPPLEESSIIQERLGSGMRALQSKIIGSYDDIFTKETGDKFVDKLVGNGSALLFVIQETESPPLGLVCFSSPVLWLFHEILFPLDKQSGRPQNEELAEFLAERKLTEQKFRKSIFICVNTLNDIDKKFLGRLASGSSGKSRNERYMHTVISDGNAKKLDLLICLKCDESISEQCVFHGMSSWIEPTLGTFLRGLKEMVDTREYYKLQNMMADLSHNFNTPLKTIIWEFDNKKELVPETERRKFDILAGELHILSSMADSVFRMLNLRADPMIFNDRAYTNIYTLFQNLVDMRFLEKLFIEAFEYKINAPKPDPRLFIKGNDGDWYVIAYNLLKNATRACQKFINEFPLKEAVGIISLNYPPDESGEFSLEIRNSSLRLEEKRLAEMYKCLNGEQERIEKNADEDGSGLGLGYIGRYISAYGFTASVEQDPNTLEVSIKISNIPVQKR